MALAAVVVLATIIALVIALRGSGAEHNFEPAPEACVEAWNGDRDAVRLGRHQFATHLYENVQVLTLAADFTESSPPEAPGARCAVIFASLSLDPEVGAAASVEVDGRWESLSGHQPPERLASLQSEAQAGYNAELESDGRISPLD